MKKLILLIAIAIGSVGYSSAQTETVQTLDDHQMINKIVDIERGNRVVLKGDILFGNDEWTRVIIKEGFETIADVYTKKRYRIRLETNKSYDITFTNGGIVKHIMVSNCPKDVYRAALDIDFLTPNDDKVAIVAYSDKIDEYIFRTLEAQAAEGADSIKLSE